MIYDRTFAAVVLIGLLGAAAQAADEGRLVLDETSYNRAHVQFATDRVSPRMLKGDEAKVLTDAAMGQLKREVRQVHRFMGREWDEATWMDHAYVLHRQGQAWNPGRHGRMNVLAATPPPPPDWSGPDFDDSAWPRLKGSLMVGTPPPAARDDVDALGRRAGFFRYRFLADDPAKAGELTLRMVYHGGVRVLLNGQEIARGHLPDGELTTDASAEEYPVEAYVRVNPDGSIPFYEGTRRKGLPYFLDDVYGRWEDAPNAGGYGVPKEAADLKMGRHEKNPMIFFDKATWEKVRKLRDRSLGPVKLPAALLRKGVNVLAVEVRASDLHPIAGGYSAFRDPFAPPYYSVSWMHAQLLEMQLRADGDGVTPMRRRPPGAQVWAEDIHKRVFTSEFSDTGDRTGTVHFVTAANGEFCGQIVVGTDRALKGLKATVGELTGPDGAKLPASAMSVATMVSHPVTDTGLLRRGGRDPGRPLSAPAARPYLRRYRPDLDVNALTDEQALEEACKLGFFDHITPVRPDEVPADSCQPIWLTLKVPADAKPGTYRGSVRVEAAGMDPVDVPVAAEVIGWRVPDTPDWQVVMQIEQSPFAVAERYSVPLWSDRHFERMEASFRQLGRIGNDWVFVPVLRNTELGNLDERMIEWIRKTDGSWDFGFTVLDRYLDLSIKHCGRPKVISFLVMHGGTNTAIEVMVKDEKTGEVKPHDVSGNSPTYQADWREFGKALYTHMRGRGLVGSMYWGYMWDAEGDPNLSSILGQVAPGVWWSSGGHGYGYRSVYKANSQIYGIDYNVESKLGWKRPDIFLLNPRGGGTVLACGGDSAAPVYRLVVDRALVSGCKGVARIAADYWDNIYFRGCKAWHYLIPGMGIASYVLWPGPDGAQPSQRFEILREGVQEGEARIYLEQALDRGGLPEDVAERVRDVLARHNRENFFVPISASGRFIDYFSAWQERSRRLFAAAEAVARHRPFDLDPVSAVVDVPPRGQATSSIVLRNWTAGPRKWTARTDAPWIKLGAVSGQTAGHDELAVTIDGTKLNSPRREAGVASSDGNPPLPRGATGKIFVSDVATGNEMSVDVTATMGPVFEFIPPDAETARQYFQFQFMPHKGRIPFNLAPGQPETKEVSVLNLAGTEIAWKAESSAAWLKVAPAGGKAAAQSPIVLKLTAAPADKAAAAHEATVTIAEIGGGAAVEVPVSAFVIPSYTEPNPPKGTPVPLDGELYNKLLVSYGGVKGAVSTGPGEMKDELARFMPKAKLFKRYLRGGSPYELVLDLEKIDADAFNAVVGFPDRWTGIVGLNFDVGNEGDRVNWEIHVDGTLRAQSGFMGPKDEFRLLVVDGLASARQLRLVARPTRLPGYALHVFWFDPTFHKAK